MTEALVNVVAQEKLAEVETLVSKLADAESQLEGGYAKLAYLLCDVSEKRYWMGTYDSFGDFLKHISTKYNLGRSQLYNFMNCARDLGDSVTQEQLNEMGISKALVLRGAKNESGSIPLNVLEAAQDPAVSVKDVKRMLYDSGTVTRPEDGSWMDLEFSCYVTESERQEIQDACNAARHMDPPINEAQKDFLQRKEILLRFSREFLAAYAENVIDGGRGL